MTEWSNEEVLTFLDYYKKEPCIWDPNNVDHKDKRKVADAWIRISKVTRVSVRDLKIKKETLMAAFRKHLKRKQESITSGAERVYEPIWFAYEMMESFLLPVYTLKLGLSSKMQSRSSDTATEEMVDEDEEEENDNSIASPSTSAAGTTPNRNKSTGKAHHRPVPDLAERQMAKAFSQLTRTLSQRQSTSADDDECDLYAKLLAKKMRELPKVERHLMMYEIDGLFVQKIKRRSFMHRSPSPQYYHSRPSSASSEYTAANRSHNPLTTNTRDRTTSADKNIDDSIIVYVADSSNPKPGIKIKTEENEEEESEKRSGSE
ncbi:uncharacterized protein LOC112052579 [Bicyclus anynana]|uniref:Uncharacterized protein LOC112052579 n=1 Tax=Bicyclus anynana TaxID=110368 RepID=A0A6J1NRI2_BICAN|nr:uncharacterized protein LOC112052579 [Bicyclus anynana]